MARDLVGGNSSEIGKNKRLDKSQIVSRNKNQLSRNNRIFSSPSSLDIVMEVLKETRTPDLRRRQVDLDKLKGVSQVDEKDRKRKQTDSLPPSPFEDFSTFHPINTSKIEHKSKKCDDKDVLYGQNYWNKASLKQLRKHVESDPFMMDCMNLLSNTA